MTLWDSVTGSGDWVLDPGSSSIWTDENGDSIVDEFGQPVNSVFVAGGGLVSGGDLVTAVLISLFTDAAAEDDDKIPDGSSDPRGWWAGDIGSKIWLRARDKPTPTLLALIKNDCERALAWLIEDEVLASITVETEFTRPTMLGVRILLLRHDGARIALKFSRLWESI